MNALVVYDSTFGNTEQIAKAIADGIAGAGTVRVVRAGVADPQKAGSVDLLLVGSPTNAGRPLQPVTAFLNRLPRLAANCMVAAFDTRIPQKFAVIFGYAAPRIAKALQDKGGTLAADPQAFFVTGGQKSPTLIAGELDRARAWGQQLVQ